MFVSQKSEMAMGAQVFEQVGVSLLLIRTVVHTRRFAPCCLLDHYLPSSLSSLLYQTTAAEHHRCTQPTIKTHHHNPTTDT